MMNTMEPHGRGMAADVAEQRIKRTEIALALSEAMVAENIARCTRMRRLVKTADRMVKIDPSNEGRRAG